MLDKYLDKASIFCNSLNVPLAAACLVSSCSNNIIRFKGFWFSYKELAENSAGLLMVVIKKTDNQKGECH